MMAIPYAILFFTCGCLWAFVDEADCDPQPCDTGTTYLICQEPNSQIPPMTMNLDMATEISDGMLPSNLTEIFMMNSNVADIQDDALDGSARTLETMSFNKCKLTNIPDAFLRLKALKHLTVIDAYIQNWNTNAMLNIGQTLGSLSLSNVGLKVWPSWLKQFQRLSELNIKNGLISSIPDDTFDLMANSLTTVTLNNNSLKAVPKAFSKLTAITTLYLEYNMISDVTWLPQISTLSILDFTGNNISNAQDLSNSIHPFASSLTYLQLDHNRLKSIPDLRFVTKITDLDLTNNLISDANSGSCPPNLYEVNLENNLLPFIPHVVRSLLRVTTLHLSFNAIKEINATDFSTSVYTVELKYNLITHLTDTSFPENSNIITLELSNNLISSISASAFTNLVNLWELDLGGNRLVRLPLALASLPRVQSLDITDNPGLVCTCLEKGLRKLIVPMSAYNVKGDCGHINIYDFFATLSAECPD